ncbi:MAG: hypothetical protein KDA37_11865 [Planctomycetales bacterium]|nr:hypothetical protein [Planctomycetales bacterium]
MVQLAVDNDFESVVDGLESVTLLRLGGGAVGLTARRVTCESSSPAGFAKGVDQIDVVWDLPWPAGQREPSLGDKVVSNEGVCGVLTQIEFRRPGRRFRVRARKLELNAALGAWVQVQQAVWEDLGSGPEITGWKPLRPAVLARVQPAGTEVDHTGAQPSSTNAVKITLAIDIPLDHNHRIIGPLDEVYRVDRFVAAERADQLPVVEGTLVASP